MTKTLELFSFTLDEKVLKEETLYYMEFPKSWRKYLESKKTGRNYFQMSIWPSNLGDQLTAMFPQIFRVDWRDWQPWLLADEKIDENLLKEICIRWFEREEIKSEDLAKSMKDERLVWQEKKVGELFNDRDFESVRFNWIPAFIARKFAREKRNLCIEGSLDKDLQFKHIRFSGKHECMSEVIYNEKRDFYFSYVMRFTYETRGFLPESGVLNVKIGIRRFLQQPVDIIKNIHGKRHGSILIGLKNPFYVNSSVQSMSQWKFEKRGNNITWTKGAGELFADILLDNEDLQPTKVVQNPIPHIENENLQVLAVYSDLVYKGYNRSRTLPGVGLPEKWALFNLIKESLPALTPLPELKEVKGWMSSARIFPLVHPYEAGSTIRLEVWHETNLKETLVEALKEVKDGTIDTYAIRHVRNNVFAIHAEPEIYVEIIERNSEGIIHGLEMDRYKDKARVEQMYMKELDTHFRRLDGRNDDEVIYSLVEIDRPEVYGQNDPKQALRTAFAKANRVTQFIHPPESKDDDDNLAMRIINSFFDLLTDAGMLPKRYKALDIDGIILSFGFIRGFGNSEYPVMSKLREGRLQMRMFGSNEWVPFQESLFKAAILEKDNLLYRYNREHKKRCESFFLNELLRVLDETDEKITVIVDHRIKYYSSIFTNGRLQSDKLFNELGLQEYKDRLHFVRINHSDEIPHYRINLKGKEKVNRNAGVYKDEAGIYYTISIRPDTMRSTKHVETKYDYPMSNFMRQRIVEFIPIGYGEEQEIDELVRLIYKMRRLTAAYRVHTTLPLQLHLNNKLAKYLTFLSDGFPWDEFDERVGVEQLEFVF